MFMCNTPSIQLTINTKEFFQVSKELIIAAIAAGEYGGCSSDQYFNLLKFVISKTPLRADELLD